jgi:O-antigen/teichoic acid export membrane protein
MLGVLVAAAAGSAALLAPLWAAAYLPAALAAWLWGRHISRTRPRLPVSLPDVPPEIAALLALSTPVPPVSRRRPPARDSRMPGSRISRREQARANARSFWVFTAPRAVANTAQNILQSIDIVLVAAIRGPKEAAVYTAATRFLVIGQLGGSAISRASQARFTQLFTLGDRKGANGIYRITTSWLVVLLWPVFLLTIAYGPLALEIFGRAYSAGYIVMVILGFSMLLATACGQVDMVLITSGRSSWSLVNGLLTMGVNVGLDLVLIPRYGITGAAIGWAVAIAASNLMPLAQLAVVLGLHPFGRATVIACVLSVVSFGLIPIGIRLALGHGPVSLAAAVAAGSVVQAAGLWRFRRTLHLPGLSRRSPSPAEYNGKRPLATGR